MPGITKNDRCGKPLPSRRNRDLFNAPMKDPDRYHRFVKWSDEDQVYIGYCPDLYLGGVCHGPNEEQVYSDLCEVVRDEVAHRIKQKKSLPAVTVRVTRDVDLISV